MSEISFPHYNGDIIKALGECWQYTGVEKGAYTNPSIAVEKTFDSCLECWEYFWTPSEISTLAWYDASDTGTIVATGNNVSSINDKSGNGITITGFSQPYTGIRTINGLNVIDHDGTSHLYANNVAMPASGNLSVFFVGIVDFLPGAFGNGIFMFDAVNNDFQVSPQTNGSTLVMYSDLGPESVIPYVGFAPNIAPAIIEVVLDWDNNKFFGMVNGDTTITTGDYLYSKKLKDIINFNLFKGSVYRPDGAWGEFLYIDSVSETYRQKIEGYLAWKWGIQAGLPIDHPYKLWRP